MLIRLLKQRRSVAALEFVLVAPVLLVLLFGVYDLSSALIYYEEVYSAAHSIAASISNAAVQSDGANSLTYSQVQQVESMIWGEIPSLRAGYQDGIKSVTVSSVVFEPLIAGCNPTAVYNANANGTTDPCANTPAGTNYIPVVVWSIAYAGGDSGRQFQSAVSSLSTTQSYYPVGSKTSSTTSIIVTDTVPPAPLRSCSSGVASIPVTPSPTIYGALNQTAGSVGASSDLTNLRTLNLGYPDTSIAPPSPFLVVDVHLKYKPIIGLFLNNGLDFWVTGYWPVRSVKTSTSQTYPLYQEFATIDPDVPSGTTPTTYNGNPVLYDQTGALAPITNYCVNNTLPNETFPYPASAENP